MNRDREGWHPIEEDGKIQYPDNDVTSFGVPNKFSGTVEGRVGSLTLRLVERELRMMTRRPLLDQLETIVRVADLVGSAHRNRGGAS